MAVKTVKNELSISRILNAPRELVWEAWSKEEHIVQWWGPVGFTNTVHKMDFTEGGEWNFIMHGPDGKNYKNLIVFNKIVVNERLEYSHINSPKFEATVTFKKYGTKTLLKVRMRFETSDDYDLAVNTHGAKQGLVETMGRLKHLVEKLN